MSVLFGLVAVLLDLLIQMGTLLAASSVVAALTRGAVIDDAGALVLFVVLAAAGLALLGWRILGRHRMITIPRVGGAEVSTVTWLHFVVDALWIAASVAMIQGAHAPLWDEGTRAAAIAALILSLAMGGLRLTVRLGAAGVPE